jgi:hypothetical protein
VNGLLPDGFEKLLTPPPPAHLYLPHFKQFIEHYGLQNVQTIAKIISF